MAEVPITFELKYEGTYEVEGGLVRVRTPFGTKAAQLGDMPAETLARMLARELVQDAIARSGK